MLFDVVLMDDDPNSKAGNYVMLAFLRSSFFSQDDGAIQSGGQKIAFDEAEDGKYPSGVGSDVGYFSEERCFVEEISRIFPTQGLASTGWV